MNLTFPINKQDGKGYTVEELFNLLSKESTGHYLLGNHNFWHGGIHFTNESASHCITDQPVRCIADGEIVAYRVNDKYLVSEYLHERDKNICTTDDLMLFYSNSFCLVKHEYQPLTREETEEPIPKNEQWVGRYFILQQAKEVRDVATLRDSECIFKGQLPKDSRIQILEVASSATGNLTIAKVNIVSMSSTELANIHPNKTADTKDIKKTVNDEVYIAVFNKECDIVNGSNGKPIIVEYTPTETLVNKTFVLKVDTPAKTTLVNQGECETTLPKGMQVEFLSSTDVNANVKISRPVSAKLIGSNSSTQVQLPAGQTVTITLFGADHESMITYEASPAKGSTPAKNAPIMEETSSPEGWRDQMVILNKETTAIISAEGDRLSTTGVHKFQLPVGTKVQILDTDPPSNEGNFTRVKLLHDVNVNIAEDRKYLFREGNILEVDLFDYYGNLKPEVQESIVKTDNPDPLYNSLTFYSLYMHLMPSDEYIDSQKFPHYWQGKATAKVLGNGLQTYSDDATKTKGAIISANGIFEYDPSETTTHQITTANNTQATLLLTKATYISGNFKGNTSLTANDSFWAVIDVATSQIIKFKPNTPNETIPCKIAIKGGESIGYLGKYQIPKPKSILLQQSNAENTNLEDIVGQPKRVLDEIMEISSGKSTPIMEASDKSQLHLEIFVPDKKELENFIQNKAKLTKGRKYLKLTIGAVIELPKQKQDASNASNVSAITSYTTKQNHIFELTKLTIEEDDAKNDWYLITLVEEGTEIKGRIRIDAANTKIITQNDWEELGFTIVEENNPVSDGFVDKDDMNPFFKALYNQLDVNKDTKVDRSELQRTLTDNDLRQRWSKLIGFHPTEWEATSESAKWSRLNDILGNKPELLRHEKERIDKLIFWDQISLSPQICHIHPIAFIDYLPRYGCGDINCFCTKDVSLNSEKFMLHDKVTNSRVPSCNTSARFSREAVKIIVLHRTASGAAQGIINHMNNAGYGAHFVVDNQRGVDGTIHQAISINRPGSHMGVGQFAETKKNGWGNQSSIGIEVCGYSFKADGSFNVGAKNEHSYWEKVTDAQAQSVACLVRYLTRYFGLTIDDVKCHEDLCSKTVNEGRDVYNAMIKLWE
ncbi:N-acetylmuramoyl-L-alanine amidase [Entomomonas asaccharolytica]|uniref:N-acetylmuramoyl-L-alanine amidase n=1 Tax=Entomomonas asaccharolytica TaxID=2785331 RepID=A0A974RW36_9GAMM|nr:peptidoglycan recognition family protein [Entomomonas asaccharolytica]QQP84785.1 N-acetylmuramoyl-L-alanine amidase [Entomomonas asaccharolytica]